MLVRDLQSNFPEAGEPRKGAWAELTHHSPFPRGTRGSFILVFSFMYSILELYPLFDAMDNGSSYVYQKHIPRCY